MRRFVGVVLLVWSGTTWAAGPPDAATWERFGKITEVHRLQNRAHTLYRTGKWAETTEMLLVILRAREALYPEELYPRGHPDLASTLTNVALVYRTRKDYARAEPFYARAFQMYARLYPRGHPELATSLNELADIHHSQGNYARAAMEYARALEMREALYPRSLYPRGHPALAASLNNVASIHQSRGDYSKAKPLFERALGMYETLYPKALYPRGHPEVAIGLNNLASLYNAQGDYTKAEPLLVRALRMREGMYPQTSHPRGHPHLALSLNNLAALYAAQGDYPKSGLLFARAVEMSESLYPESLYPQGHPELAHALGNLAMLHSYQGDFAKAESLYKRSIQMIERLYPRASYPRGHPHLAISLNNLAMMHWSQADYAKAEPLYVRALQMYERLYPRTQYPKGHPNLALSLHNLGTLYNAARDFEKAEPLYVRALVMREALYSKARYPQGHPDVAICLNNLASLHHSLGDYTKAESEYTRGLEINEGLYPKDRYPEGHPDLALSLTNLAALYKMQGEYGKAEPLCARSLRMYSDSATSVAAYSSEATALNYLSSQPLARDDYLTVTNHLPKSDAYSVVWQTKAALARVSERRHFAVLAASSREAHALWEAILSLKRERERLLLAATDGTRTRARDARLDEIDESIRKKEVELRPLLPALKRSDDLARATPAGLQKALPADAAFIDLLRYTRIERDPKLRGDKGEKRTVHYVGFVVTRGDVTRVELGEAKPIEEALALWRRAIDENSDSHAKYAGTLRARVWAPLAKHLPAATKTVYLCPDMDLSRLPWAALPGQQPGTILLEDHLLVTVPHGPYLLDRLTTKHDKAPIRPSVLAMGGVAYDRSPEATEVISLRSPVEGKGLWPALAGTGTEVSSLKKLSGDRDLVTLSGDKAGSTALLVALPRADIAHLATHGYFADKKFRSVLQLDEKLFSRGLVGDRASAGSRSPMVLSGLVCAGANLDSTPNRGIVTADAIVGLDLRRLDLAVLSACETGLGDVAGGEGVFGLQRAFHVAGTRVVVASLWQVPDEGTAALMSLFYRNLWSAKLSAPEAMRQAQLAVYRDPTRVKEWAAGRGPLPKPVAGGTAKPLVKGAKVSSPKVYAAFVVSGVAR